MRVSTRGSAPLLIVGLGGLLAFPSVGAGESLVAAQERRILRRRSLRRLVTPPAARLTHPPRAVPIDVSQPSAPQPAPGPTPAPPPQPPAPPTAPRSSDEPSRPVRSVELRFWYHRQPVQARLERQRRVPAAPPQHRKVKPQAGDLVLQGEDRSGKVLWQRPISDPTILFDDTPSRTGTAETPPRGLVLLEAAPLWVYVPSDPALARVSLFAPIEIDESGAQKPWQSLGAWRIEP